MEDHLPPLDMTLTGTCWTLRARPKAPGNELLSRTTNVPGALSFRNCIATNISNILKRKPTHRVVEMG